MTETSKTLVSQEQAIACWNCQAAAGSALFCPQCGKIQPQRGRLDFFRFLGLPRKLNLDLGSLEKTFHALSWKLHPDNFYNASPEEQRMSLDGSAVLNDAYRTLRDPLSRVEYLLSLEGVRKEGETKQQAPPDLLEEVFDLNESLDELRMAKKAHQDGEELASLRQRLESARQNFTEKLRQVEQELFTAFARWDALLDGGAAESERRAVLQQMSQILNRRSYVRNLVRDVQKELEE